jgi:hypothetical protein
MRVHRSFLPSTSSKHLNFLVSQPTTTLSHATPKHFKTYPLSSLPPHPLIAHSLPNIHPPILTTASTPHHNSISLNSIVNMRSFAIFGVAALVASVAGQTGTINSTHFSNSKKLITNKLTVTVTVTETYCGAGMCPPIAARQEPSNGPGTTNALSVLSSAYASVIAAYTSAQATDSSLPSLTFVPELFSSYGLTGVGSTNEPSSPTAAPSDSSVASSNPTDVENSQTSAATSPAPVSPGSPSATPSSYGGVSTTTEETTVPAATTPASEAPSSGESTANPAQTSGTAAVPVPVPSSITDSSAISSYVSSVQSSLSSEASANPTGGETTTGGETATDSATESPSATDSESAGASTTEAPSSSASGESGSSSSEADAATATSATTTEAPPAEQTNNAAGTNQLPVAMGGLAAAVAGMLFI